MKYVMAYTGRRGPTPLDDGSTRESVSAECRQAALEFMRGAARGWDKLDLAMWLTGAYARATRHSMHGERVAGMNGQQGVEVEALEQLVTRVRSQVFVALDRAAHTEEGTLDFTEELVQAELIRRAVDLDGCEVWIPVDGVRMRLRERVRALFAADYLNAPHDYANLYTCWHCGAVVFDANAKRLDVCPVHHRDSSLGSASLVKRHSGLVPRSGDHERASGDD